MDDIGQLENHAHEACEADFLKSAVPAGGGGLDVLPPGKEKEITHELIKATNKFSNN